MITAIRPDGHRILFKDAGYLQTVENLDLQILYKDKTCDEWVANIPLTWATINGNALER
jgi:hypothetical protein